MLSLLFSPLPIKNEKKKKKKNKLFLNKLALLKLKY